MAIQQNKKTEAGGQKSDVGGQICRRDVLVPINVDRMSEDGSHFPFPVSPIPYPLPASIMGGKK
ncbi:MAG: hypothetical protein K8T10_00445 [Candidatus Eremiobacteraeota bacterium]|nr:hypothetical protein [Candidatus Eremiobacteraeota bacterium]